MPITKCPIHEPLARLTGFTTKKRLATENVLAAQIPSTRGFLPNGIRCRLFNLDELRKHVDKENVTTRGCMEAAKLFAEEVLKRLPRDKFYAAYHGEITWKQALDSVDGLNARLATFNLVTLPWAGQSEIEEWFRQKGFSV